MRQDNTGVQQFNLLTLKSKLIQLVA